ncbi:MAG: hypothetical protein HQM10_07190 [Candidatus Riflebacteria bacterium]|nr:hypothetical protein [Candidatus Riflebacteria bacterium]
MLKSNVTGITFEKVDGILIIRSNCPLGEDSGKEIERLAKAALDEGSLDFIIDFGMTKAISSPAVAAILNTTEEIVDLKNGRVLLSGLTELNVKVFEMVGILFYADIASNIEEARKRFQTGAAKHKKS